MKRLPLQLSLNQTHDLLRRSADHQNINDTFISRMSRKCYYVQGGSNEITLPPVVLSPAEEAAIAQAEVDATALAASMSGSS